VECGGEAKEGLRFEVWNKTCGGVRGYWRVKFRTGMRWEIGSASAYVFLLRPEERTVVLRKLSKKLKVTFKRDVYMALILSS
jgi:hypothetical protein